MPESYERLQSALPATYRIKRELGRGSFAIGYHVDDRAGGREAVLKVLRPEIAAVIDADQFLKAIHSATELQHPNILAVYDSGRAGEFLYFVRPFVEGDSLRDRLDRETQLALEDALEITREVSDSLGFAHSHDVVHGDIRPENILFRGGHAVVSDFGVEKAVLAAAGHNLAVLANVVDTSSYMSPELLTGNRKLDERSDVYSLGCVLYEMLAGEHPPGPPADPPRITALRPGVPYQIVDALERAIARSPEQRFPTAGQFCDALRVARLSTGKFALLSPTRHHASRLLPGLAILVLLILVLVWLWL
jgi:serine/threonine-protein kinase